MESIPEMQEEFKKNMSSILKSKTPIDRKLQLCRYLNADFIESIKYAKTNDLNIRELYNWLLGNKAIKRLAYTRKAFYGLSGELHKQYLDKKTGNMMFFPKRNFFWNIKEVREAQYRHFFSPYTER